MISTVIKQAAGRVPVLAGVGGMSTREGIEHALIGKNAGADGLMIASPAYSVPTQDEIADHMRAVVDAAGIPAVLYDYPSRIGVSIEAEALDVLADHPLIVGIKEASGDLARLPLPADALARAGIGPEALAEARGTSRLATVVEAVADRARLADQANN